MATASNARELALVSWLQAHRSALLGFSGGVDSSYLACVALEALGPNRLLSVIGRSASYPEEQWVRARAVAEQFGIPVIEVDTNELTDPRYASNPVNRCYFCKTELWSLLTPIAENRGLAVVIDGTNADDMREHRPGRAAAAEQGVRSPLAELGFTKQDIRDYSEARGIPTWRAPSSPCLASRIPYGTEVTPLRLGRVEGAERALRAIGVTGDLRVRYFGDTARVELGPDQLALWSTAGAFAVLRSAVAGAGFTNVELDPRGFRSGALNEHIASFRNAAIVK